MVDEKIEFLSLTNDMAFKTLWYKGNSDVRKYLERMIEYIIRKPIKDYDFGPNEQGIMTYKQIANKVDVLLISKDKTRKIDIEMNKVKEEKSSLYNIKVIERKSDIYYGNMLANYYTDIKDKKYKIDINTIQINFNCYYCPYDKNKEISFYVPYNVKDKRIKKGRKQYFVYLPRIRDLCYTLDDEERKDFALLLAKSYEEMDELAKGNKEREAVVKLVKKIRKG